MNKDIVEKIKKIKKKYGHEGFVIIGIFGSFARDTFRENSDIDILYELKDEFYNKYPGFKIIPILDEIETEIQRELNH